MKVICIAGKARHGKDSAAEIITSALTHQGYKVMTVHYGDYVKFICSMYFGWNGEKDDAGRSLLQHVGTDIVRKKSPNFWVDAVIDVLRLFGEENDYVLIPDTRFPNEIQALCEAGFDVITLRVIRENFTSNLTPEQPAHPSETALDDFPFKYELRSPSGLDNLRKAVAVFLGWLVNMK